MLLKSCDQLSLVVITCFIAANSKVRSNKDSVTMVKVWAAAAKVKLCQHILVNVCLHSQQTDSNYYNCDNTDRQCNRIDPASHTEKVLQVLLVSVSVCLLQRRCFTCTQQTKAALWQHISSDRVCALPSIHSWTLVNRLNPFRYSTSHAAKISHIRVSTD